MAALGQLPSLSSLTSEWRLTAVSDLFATANDSHADNPPAGGLFFKGRIDGSSGQL